MTDFVNTTKKPAQKNLIGLIFLGIVLGISCLGPYPLWILPVMISGWVCYHTLGRSPFTCWLFCALIYQLLQISVKVICGTFGYALPVNPIRDFPVSELFSSYAIACTGIALFAWMVRRTLGEEDLSWKIDTGKIINQTSLFVVCTGMAVLWSMGVSVRFLLPGAFFLMGCEYFRYVLICLLLVFFIKESGSRLLTGSFLLVELLLDIGFFSSFKTPIFLLILVVTSLEISQDHLIKRKFLMAIPILLIFLFVLSVVWTGIKGDYRNYLTGGEKMQGSRVSQIGAVNYFIESIQNYQWQDDDVQRSLLRLSYIDFFHATRCHIPEYLPYQYGTECLSAVTGLLPRVLFPGKRILDDSFDTIRLTGMTVAGRDEATSIGVGYMAYLYADFGDFGVLAGMIVLGFAMGKLLNLLRRISADPDILYMIVIPLFFGFFKFETTLAKSVQGFMILYLWALFFLFLWKRNLKKSGILNGREIEETGR